MTQDNIDWELTIKKDGRTVTDGWVEAFGDSPEELDLRAGQVEVLLNGQPLTVRDTFDEMLLKAKALVAQGLGEAPTAQQIQEAEDLLAMADRL